MEPRRRLKAVVVKGLGATSTQEESLSTILGDFTHEVDIKILSREQFHERDNEMELREISSELLAADFHIISTHIPQGQPDKMRELWDLSTYPAEMAKLNDRVGFPFGSIWGRAGHQDPTFLQDKYTTIEKLPEFFLPSLKIALTPDGSLTEAQMEEIIRFCRHNYELDPQTGRHVGYIWKTPYTTHSTNGNGRRFCTTIEEVFRFYRKFCDELYGHLPYIFLQARIANNHEYKVCQLIYDVPEASSSILPAEFLEPFEVHVEQQGSNTRRTATDDEVIAFAKRAIKAYQEKIGPTGPILRVDIFKTQSGRLVVNEFESLEAVVSPTGRQQGKDSRIKTYLQAYWRSVMQLCISTCKRMRREC